MPVSRLLVGYGALTLLLLLGCSGDPEPEVAPAPSVSTPSGEKSPSESTSAQPTEKPESAEQFIQRWVSAQNLMLQSGDTTDYAAMTRGCRTCKELIEQVQSIYASGGWIKGGTWTVLSTESIGLEGRVEVFRVRLKTVTSRYKESSTTPVRTSKGGNPTARVSISWRASEWNLDDFGQEA